MSTLADRLPGRFAHPAWATGVATAVGYGVVLVAMTVLLFLVPWALFVAL